MPGKRRIAAVLSADAVVEAHRQEVALLVGQHHGRVVFAPGDTLLAEFPTAGDAVECALDVQRALEARNAPLPREQRLQLRVGVHLGEVHTEDGRISGDAVDVAAGIETLAEPGGVLVSKAVRDQARALTSLRFHDLGERSLEKLTYPVHLFRVRGSERVRSERGVLVRMLLATVLLTAAAVWALCPAFSGR